MNKNILLILGSIFIMGLVVFLVNSNKNDKNESVNQDQRDVVRSEIKDRVGAEQVTNGEYEVDKESSRIEWTGKAVGKKHNGQVDIKNATINFSDGTPSGGIIVFDMTSISDDDLESDMQQKLVAHLKSDDFFAVADYPESRLEIKNAQKIEGDNMYRVTADLTIKDETNEVVFDTEVEEKNGIVVLSTSFEIDRTEWGVSYGSENVAEKLGDQLIDDMISFDVVFVGSKNDEVANDIFNNQDDGWRNTVLKDVRTGEEFRISDFADDHVVIESFAVWCPTCLKQQSEVKKSQANESVKVVHIGLNTDPNEDEDAVLQYINENNFDWLYAVAPIEMTRNLTEEFGLGIVSAPQAPMIHVCPDGSVEQFKKGLKSAEDLQEYIANGCSV